MHEAMEFTRRILIIAFVCGLALSLLASEPAKEKIRASNPGRLPNAEERKR